MNFPKLAPVGAAGYFQPSSDSFLKLAEIADSNSDPKVRRQADFFDGCHWLALGNIDEAANRFRKVRTEIPQADTILKKMEADRLRFANLSALEAWDLYNREAETMQKDVDQGYLARIFSSKESLNQAREKRFGPERKLIQELKRRIEAGEIETLSAGLKQIQESGPEELKELSAFLLSKDAKTYVGDPRPALIEFASNLNPEKIQVEFLLQRTAELEHQSDMPSTCYAVNALVRGLSSPADVSTGGQFAATLAKLALSASAEGVASDVALMFASAGLGNLAKLSALTKLEKIGFTGYKAVAVASGAGVGVESTAFWAGNTAKDAAIHDPEKILRAEQLAQHYGATLLTIGGLKVFGKVGEGLAASVGKNPNLAGQALAQGMKHGSGLAGLTASNQLNQTLGWHEKPQGGFAESFAGDLFSYVEFAAAHKMADGATGKALSKIQEKQQNAIAARERKLLFAKRPASPRPILLHPIFAPLWASLGSGGIGGGDGWDKPDPRTFLQAIESILEKIPHSDEWHHKVEQGEAVAAGSHRGIGYDEHNEDRYFFGENLDGRTLMVAIDGLGGHLDGEQASAIVQRAFESGSLIGLTVPEILALAHQTVAAYTLKNHSLSWRNRGARLDPGSVAAAVEIEPGQNGEYVGRFWNIGDAEAVVLRISPDGSAQVVHHTTRPPTDAFERKRDGEPFSATADGRLELVDIFDHRLIDSPVESFLGDKKPAVHYQRKALQSGDIVLVGSDGFFENFASFDLIGKIIAESGAKTSAQVHEALFQESLIRMALLDIANNQELTHEVYVAAYRRALGKEPPVGWKGMYEPTIGLDGERKSHIVYYRGILDMDTGQVVDSLKQDNLTLLVQVLGINPPGIQK